MHNPFQGITLRDFVLLVLGGILSYLLIPLGFLRYNDIKSLREARLARALQFGKSNDEFNRQVNTTATLLRFVADHNDREPQSNAQLAEARKELYKSYEERRLELDGSVWWWTSEFAREATAMNLLAPNEIKQMNDDVVKYKDSVLGTMNQVTYLWRFLDSPQYKLDASSRQKRKDLEQTMDAEFSRQFVIRDHLVDEITTLFINSNHRTGFVDFVVP